MRAGIFTGQRLAMVQGQPRKEAVAEAARRGVPLQEAGQAEIAEMIGIERMRISSKSFFQVNSEGARRMVELIMEALAPEPENTVADFFAGVGLFSVPLARVANRVFAVERSAAALRDLRHHAQALRGKLHIVGTGAQEAFHQLPKSVDLLVADPPREGLGRELAARLCTLRARCIALISCDPASLARDARSICDHGYRLQRVTPLDLFPQTYHVEALSLFEAS
jgi:23S rRNA (uracil1939-C5)-methyltransferase